MRYRELSPNLPCRRSPQISQVVSVLHRLIAPASLHKPEPREFIFKVTSIHQRRRVKYATVFVCPPPHTTVQFDGLSASD